MQTIIFYEDIDPSRMVVAAFVGERLAWRDVVVKQSLEAWLKEAFQKSRLEKSARLIAVYPETVVGRRVLTIPGQGRAHERRAMAENALMIALNERVALLRMVPVVQASSGQETWAISGVGRSVFCQWQGYFGRLAARVKWLSAIECALAFCEVPLQEGMYSLEAPLWSSVFVIQNGMVLYGAATEGRELASLQMMVAEETEGFDVSFSCIPVYFPHDVVLREGLLLEGIYKKTRYAHSPMGKNNRAMMVLFVGCVVLPGLIWLGLQARPAPVEEVPEEGIAPSTVVVQSHYSTLIEGAYQAKSERITILSQEASEDALAIHGRCKEVLDLADYMRSLDKADPALHPLLLDLAKKTEKERYYYEFVVEIALEGRETP